MFGRVREGGVIRHEKKKWRMKGVPCTLGLTPCPAMLPFATSSCRVRIFCVMFVFFRVRILLCNLCSYLLCRVRIFCVMFVMQDGDEYWRSEQE